MVATSTMTAFVKAFRGAPRFHRAALTHRHGSFLSVLPMASALAGPRSDHGRRSRLFSSSDFQESSPTLLSYITDVEGDAQYLQRYANRSTVLKFVDCAPRWEPNDLHRRNHESFYFPYDHTLEFQSPRGILVYGGDCWDKGGRDLYVMRQLLDLKRRYPDRVFFILGNRDTNKLRILQELGVSQQEQMPHHPGLRWLQGTGRIGDPDCIKENPIPSDAPGRLEWMLSNTMGSQNAFALRRSELRWEHSLRRAQGLQGSKADISDDDVVQSYRDSCHPNGELGMFLSQSCLAKRIGDVFFVHGALPLTDEVLETARKLIDEGKGRSIWDDMTFALPWIEESDDPVSSVDEWIDKLNEYCSSCIEKWTDHIAQVERGIHSGPSEIWIFKGGYHTGPSYSGLLQYGMGSTPKGKNPTVIYNTWCPDGLPSRFFPDDSSKESSLYAKLTSEFLERGNLKLIVTGHKPQGDLPTPIRVSIDDDKSSAWILACDTSYSGDTMWHNNDNKISRENLGRGSSLSFRGDVAVSEVLIEQKDGVLQSVHSHGVLSDGSMYESKNLLDLGELEEKIRIGELAPEPVVPNKAESPNNGPWWAKTAFSDDSILYHTAEGFHVWNFLPEQTKN